MKKQSKELVQEMDDDYQLKDAGSDKEEEL